MKEILRQQDKKGHYFFFTLILCCFTGLAANNIAQHKIQIYPFEKTQIPKEITFKGTIIECAKYADADGVHILIIAEYTKGEYMTQDYVSEIYAGDYLEKNGNLDLLWKIWDAGNSPGATVGYEKGRMRKRQ